MVSILIPVYNFDIRALVQALHEQATAAAVEFEIRCYDDGSTDGSQSGNRTVETFSNVVWKPLPNNIGRSAIRNLLATDAQYPQLLFMDCDSAVASNEYIANYVEHTSAEAVVCGGRIYEAVPPGDPSRLLRWQYGTQREVIDVQTRIRHPYRSFMTNNFMVPKALFLAIGLDERLTGYGHEDTLFGKALKDRSIEIRHIDNPLIHIGLESSEEFLDKTLQGIRNLAFLIREGAVDRDVKLYRYYRLLKRAGLLIPTAARLKRDRHKMLDNLHSGAPDLRKFDLFKLDCLIRELKNSPVQ